MLCYSFLEKRGDYIKKLVNWRLLNEGNVVINNNIECEYEVNKFIKYNEDKDTYNVVNLENNIYVRENNEFIFKIDFNNKIFSYILKENDIEINDNIDCNLQIKEQEIKLKYNLDNEEKEIIIQIL